MCCWPDKMTVKRKTDIRSLFSAPKCQVIYKKSPYSGSLAKHPCVPFKNLSREILCFLSPPTVRWNLRPWMHVIVSHPETSSTQWRCNMREWASVHNWRTPQTTSDRRAGTNSTPSSAAFWTSFSCCQSLLCFWPERP